MMMQALLSGARLGIAGLAMGSVPKPEPGPGQVRIRVSAVGVNFPDLLIIEDKYQFRPERPFAPGGEVAGIVDAVGVGVRSLSHGERVLAMTISGGMAEYVLADESRTCVVPQAMPFDHAASLMLTYGTAYNALVERAAAQEGETLLVLGAAGGVGLACVEVGRALGMHVVAAASSSGKIDLAKALGADEGIIYPADLADRSSVKQLSADFKATLGAAGAHVIVDPVGGNYAEAALRSIAWHGRYLVIGFPAGIPSIPLNLPLLKSCEIIGVFFGGELEKSPDMFRETAMKLIAMYEAGKIKPRIDACYDLKDGGLAIGHVSERRALGKIVVSVNS